MIIMMTPPAFYMAIMGCLVQMKALRKNQCSAEYSAEC
jgi:hypothetical protein